MEELRFRSDSRIDVYTADTLRGRPQNSGIARSAARDAGCVPATRAPQQRGVCAGGLSGDSLLRLNCVCGCSMLSDVNASLRGLRLIEIRE